MKHKITLFLLAIFSPLTIFCQTYISDVTVVDVLTKRLLPGQTVVIKKDLISDIRPVGEIKAPENAKIINGTGKFLIPGLTDGHIHFFQSGGLYTRPDVIDLRKYKSYESQVKWSMGNMDDLMRRYVRAGITSVVDVGSSYNFLKLRNELSKGEHAPTIYMTGPLLTTWVPDPYKDLKNDSPFELPATVAEARQIVQKQLAFRPDFIKIWYVVDSKNVEESARKHLPMVKAVIDEAHKHKLKVAVHAPERFAAQLAVENGCDYLVHSVEDEIVSDAFVQLLKVRKTLLCPTLIVYGGYNKTLGQRNNYSLYELTKSNPDQIGSLDDLKHLPVPDAPKMKEFLNSSQFISSSAKKDSIILHNLKKLADNGVLIVAGTDAGNIGTQHATSLLAELKAMQQSGLTTWQVLESATINAAKLFDNENQTGSISVGKTASMILLNANPLTDLGNLTDIALVFNKGIAFQPDTLIKETPLALVQRQLNAYNARNIEAFLEPYADDVELYEYPDKLFSKGKNQMRKDYQGMFEKLPNLHCEIKERTIKGNVITDKEIVTGMGPNKVEATAIYHIADNKISKVYFVQ
ncbi:MAG: amidohydrolase family protein [Bacteroidota bacterium]